MLYEMMLGRREYPTSAAHRHHYVPESILRRFKASRGGGRKLHQLDKLSGNCEEVDPAKIGWIEDLYVVESTTGEHDGFIEGLFALAENFAAVSIDKLLKHPGDFDEGDRGNIAFLLAIQEVRVPAAMRELEDQLEQLGTMLVAVEAANTKGSKTQRELGKQAYEEIAGGRIRIRPPSEAIFEAILSNLFQHANTMYQAPWVLLETESPRFVTSDSPIVWGDPNPPQPWTGPGLLSSDTVFAHMALSKRACLRISPTGLARFARRTGDRQAANINLRAYGSADRYVYGPSEVELTKLHQFASDNPEDVPAPRKRHQVILEDPATADPAVAESNRARGWKPYLYVTEPDGSQRKMSYEVLEGPEDARRAIAPRRAPEHKTAD